VLAESTISSVSKFCESDELEVIIFNASTSTLAAQDDDLFLPRVAMRSPMYCSVCCCI